MLGIIKYCNRLPEAIVKCTSEEVS